MKEIKVKSNGLRNELKEIRKSIDALTNAILMAQTNQRLVTNGYVNPRYTVTSDAQTNEHEEVNTYVSPLNGTGLHGTTEGNQKRKI